MVDVVANVHFGDLRRRTEVRRSTSSPRWELELEFAISSWTEELVISLHDATAGRAGSSLGTLSLKLLDLGDARRRPVA